MRSQGFATGERLGTSPRRSAMLAAISLAAGVAVTATIGPNRTASPPAAVLPAAARPAPATTSGGVQYAQQVLGASTVSGHPGNSAASLPTPERGWQGFDPRLVFLPLWLAANVVLLLLLRRQPKKDPEEEEAPSLTLGTWRYMH